MLFAYMIGLRYNRLFIYEWVDFLFLFVRFSVFFFWPSVWKVRTCNEIVNVTKQSTAVEYRQWSKQQQKTRPKENHEIATKQKQNKKSNASRKERTRRNGWSCIWQQIFDDVDAIQWFFLTFSLFYFICYISADMCVLPFRCKFTKSTNRLHPSSDSFFLFFFCLHYNKTPFVQSNLCTFYVCVCDFLLPKNPFVNTIRYYFSCNCRLKLQSTTATCYSGDIRDIWLRGS